MSAELSEVHKSTDPAYAIIGLIQGASTVVMAKANTINIIDNDIAIGMYSSCLDLLKMIINIYHSLRKIDDFLLIILSENTRGNMDHIKRKSDLVDAFVSLFSSPLIALNLNSALSSSPTGQIDVLFEVICAEEMSQNKVSKLSDRQAIISYSLTAATINRHKVSVFPRVVGTIIIIIIRTIITLII